MAERTARYKQNRLQQLRGFCFAAHSGSMSKAAEKMFLSQPSVSLQIQALERELKVKLFERKGPKIELTHDGELLYELALPLVDGFSTLEESFEARRQSIDVGRLRIAAGGSTIQYVLPPFVEKFVEQYPKIDLRLINVTGKDGMEMLRAGEVDFCVGPMLDIPDDIEFRPIVSYEPLLITEKGHPLAKKKQISPRQISKYPLILPPRHLSTWRQVEYAFAQEGLPYEVRLEVGGWEVIKKYVGLGLGVSIVMSICISDADYENLEIISVKDYFPRRTYGVVVRKDREMSPQTRGFIDILDSDITSKWVEKRQAL